jgi:hypothetical protein
MATLRRISRQLLIPLVCCLLLAGCSKSTKSGGDKSKETDGGGRRFSPGNLSMSSDLKQLSLAYQNCLSSGRPPANAKQLAPFFENDQKLLNKLESEEIVFLYGVGLNQMQPQGPGRTIIAYEKDAPTQGGYVALGDATVKKVTAEEFKTLKLAGKR